MANHAQNRANRQNAKRSTGARTPEGKTRSSLNALKHGLTSRLVVLPTEPKELYESLRSDLLEHYQPENAMEEYLVDHLAQQMWRMWRSRGYETGMLSAIGKEPQQQGAPTESSLDHHRRYETNIERQMIRALDRLDRILQRRTQPPPPQREQPKALRANGFVSQNPVDDALAPAIETEQSVSVDSVPTPGRDREGELLLTS